MWLVPGLVVCANICAVTIVPTMTYAMEKAAVAQIAAALEGKSFLLKVDLHEPDPAADNMQAPTLERRGWHHHNPGGPVALKAGTQIQVTGVFNYSERGLFLELARQSGDDANAGIAARPRARIRIMVEALPADPAGQAREAADLIGKVLQDVASP